MIERGYAAAPTADFSRGILEKSPQSLAVSRLPHVGWSDLGTPQRVMLRLAPKPGASRLPALAPAWALEPSPMRMPLP